MDLDDYDMHHMGIKCIKISFLEQFPDLLHPRHGASMRPQLNTQCSEYRTLEKYDL